MGKFNLNTKIAISKVDKFLTNITMDFLLKEDNNGQPFKDIIMNNLISKYNKNQLYNLFQLLSFLCCFNIFFMVNPNKLEMSHHYKFQVNKQSVILFFKVNNFLGDMLMVILRLNKLLVVINLNQSLILNNNLPVKE